MEIDLKIHTSSSQEKIKKDKDSWEIWIHEKPIDNLANKSIIALISKELKIPKTKIKIIKGVKSKIKKIKINYD